MDRSRGYSQTPSRPPPTRSSAEAWSCKCRSLQRTRSTTGPTRQRARTTLQADASAYSSGPGGAGDASLSCRRYHPAQGGQQRRRYGCDRADLAEIFDAAEPELAERFELSGYIKVATERVHRLAASSRSRWRRSSTWWSAVSRGAASCRPPVGSSSRSGASLAGRSWHRDTCTRGDDEPCTSVVFPYGRGCVYVGVGALHLSVLTRECRRGWHPSSGPRLAHLPARGIL